MYIHTHKMIAFHMPLTTHRIRSRKGSHIHLKASMAARNRYPYSNPGNLLRYHPKAIERPIQSLKTGSKELAQTPPMRQLSEPFLAEDGMLDYYPINMIHLSNITLNNFRIRTYKKQIRNINEFYL